MKNLQKKTKKIIVIILLCALLVITCTSVGVVFAKYITAFQSGELRFSALNFRFFSTHAENTAETPYYVVSNSISLELSNSDGLVRTNVPIAFNVKLDGVQVISDTFEGKQRKQVEITSVSEGLHTVTITSTSPYKKTITLYFYVYTSYNGSFYKVIHHDNWVELRLFVGADNSDITVNYTGVAPDFTNDALSAFCGGSGTLTNLCAGSNYTFVFFGEVSAETNPFELTQNGQTIIKGE